MNAAFGAKSWLLVFLDPAVSEFYAPRPAQVTAAAFGAIQRALALEPHRVSSPIRTLEFPARRSNRVAASRAGRIATATSRAHRKADLDLQRLLILHQGDQKIVTTV